MLLIKFVLFVGVFLVYGLLVLMYFSLEERYDSGSCPHFETCIRTCCSSDDKCDRDAISKAFNSTIDFEVEDSDETSEYREQEVKMLHGKPLCSMFKGMEGNLSRKWEFFYNGHVHLKGENSDWRMYSQDQYCIEDVKDEEGKFNLLTCKDLRLEMDVIKYLSSYQTLFWSVNWLIECFSSARYLLAFFRDINFRRVALWKSTFIHAWKVPVRISSVSGRILRLFGLDWIKQVHVARRNWRNLSDWRNLRFVHFDDHDEFWRLVGSWTLQLTWYW